MERSATPFSWWTCGGHVVWVTRDSSRSSRKWRERNSPALSVWMVETTRTTASERRLASALNDAMKRRTRSGASDLARREVDELEAGVVVGEHEGVLEILPSQERLKGPAMSACTNRPA